MATGKFERELKFIFTDTMRLEKQLSALKASVPSDPDEAKAKADQVCEIEERLAQLYSRKKEIEDSFIELGMDVPDINRSLNESGCREVEQGEKFFGDGLDSDENRLTQQIKSVSDEIMQVEMEMVRAELDDDSAEHQKLSMCASSLRVRRDALVEEMKKMRAEKRAAEQEAPEQPAGGFQGKLDALEADNRALRMQISDVRSDVMEIKGQLRELLEALRPE